MGNILRALYRPRFGEIECVLSLVFYQDWSFAAQGVIVLKAILTDNHFWIPLFVLVIGIALLAFLH